MRPFSVTYGIPNLGAASAQSGNTPLGCQRNVRLDTSEHLPHQSDDIVIRDQ